LKTLLISLYTDDYFTLHTAATVDKHLFRRRLQVSET